MRRVFALFEKDLKNGLRNWEILLAVLLPIVMSGFFNTALNTVLSGKVPFSPRVAVFCPDEELKAVLLGIKQFREINFSKSWDEAVSMVEQGKVHGAIRLPEDFARRAKAHERLEIEVLLDGTATIRGAVIRAAVNSFIDKYSEITSPVKATIKELKGATLRQKILPVWVVMMILMVGLMAVPMSLGEEKTEKTLAAVLLTPTSEREVILAKGIWGAFLIVLSAMALLLLNDGLRGNNGLLLVILLLGTASIVGIGLFISILSPTLSTASLVSPLVMIVMIVPAVVPSFLMGSIRRLVWVMPGYQLVEGLRKAILLKVGFRDVWQNLLVLSCWALAFLWVNAWALKRKKL